MSYEQAVALHRSGKLAEAEAAYRALADEDPANKDAWFGLGAVAAQTGRPSEAIQYFEHSIQAGGMTAAHHHNLAGVKATLGRFAEAEAHFKEALRFNPNYYEAYFNYANSRSFKEDGARLAGRVEALLDTDRLAGGDLCQLHFAAGKLWTDAGEPDRAWQHFVAGNKARGAAFDPVETGAVFQSVVDTFDEDLMRRKAGLGDCGNKVIFIVGMPRSGTTLVEQMIATHPQVHAAGELPDIPSIATALAERLGRPFPGFVDKAEPQLLAGFGRAYVERIIPQASGKPILVDKNPLNFRFVGLIRLMFGEAHIVWTRRDPLDTCLSCYFQNFRSGQEYSFDLDHLAWMYGWHERLMRHWARRAGPVIEVDYARLVAEPETESQRLFAAIGLEWTPDVMAFHRHDRKVETASKWQVRQPLYTAAVGRSQAYRRHLAPLAEALKRYGVTG